MIPSLDLPINQNPEFKHSAKYSSKDNNTNRSSASSFSSYRSSNHKECDDNNLSKNDENLKNINEPTESLNRFQPSRFNFSNQSTSEEELNQGFQLPLSSRLKLSSRQPTLRRKSQNFSIMQTIPDINSPINSNQSNENNLLIDSAIKYIKNPDDSFKSNRSSESLSEVTNNSERNIIDHLEAKYKSITNELLDDKKERIIKIPESLKPISLNPNPEAIKPEISKSSRNQNKAAISSRFSKSLEINNNESSYSKISASLVPSQNTIRKDEKQVCNNSSELESVKKHAAKLQSLVKDLQRTLAEKNLQIQYISNIVICIYLFFII